VNRRKFLQFLGAGAGVTAAVVIAPEAVKFFLPPRGGWNSWTYSTKDAFMSLDDFEYRILQPAMERVAAQLDEQFTIQVGDIVSFDGVYDPHAPRLKLFKVTSVGQSAWS
jgi:hypothetical protein